MPFGGAGHLSDQIFHAPRSQAWHYAAELRTLSVTYPLCGSALTDTTDNPSEMCPLKTYRLLPVFVPLIIHNLTRAAYSPNGFHKLSRPGLEPATPRWESQHSNHAATPTCFTYRTRSIENVRRDTDGIQINRFSLFLLKQSWHGHRIVSKRTVGLSLVMYWYCMRG